MAHPLEGKHFVFDFYADYTDGGEALAVLKVVDGKLVDFWHPCERADSDSLGDRVNKMLFEELKKQGIKELLTLSNQASPYHGPEKFLGYALHGNNEEVWWNFDNLRSGEWEDTFEENDIKLDYINSEDL